VRRAAFLGGVLAFSAIPAAATASVAEHVAAIARSSTGVVGIDCRTLASAPPVFSYNARMEFPAASTIKVLVMATAFVIEEQKPGTLDELIITHRADVIGGSDFMQNVPDGERLRVRELIVPMIAVSDNTASNLLIAHFGIDTINSVAHSAGMASTRLAHQFVDAGVTHNENVTTPSDMSMLLWSIAHAAREDLRTIASPAHCRQMIDIMLRQTDRDGIPAGLPPKTQVANKTGEITGTRNDVAIVEPFADSPYVLSIYTKWVNDYDAAYDTIHRIAALSYDLAGRSNQ
jgi:beta-lactamase class A